MVAHEGLAQPRKPDDHLLEVDHPSVGRLRTRPAIVALFIATMTAASPYDRIRILGNAHVMVLRGTLQFFFGEIGHLGPRHERPVSSHRAALPTQPAKSN